MERAEDLFAQIDPDQTYPEDWVVFAITGYRPRLESPSQFVGAALLGDLSMLVERLSAAAGIKEEELRPAVSGNGGSRAASAPPTPPPAPSWRDVPELCRRWSISRKTLDRYRRQGLPGRRVIPASGARGAGGGGGASGRARQKLLFSSSAVASFESRHAPSLAKAAAFTRIPAELEPHIVRVAARAQRRFGWSLSTAALKVAGHFDRGHETIRQLLRRQRDEAGKPLFDQLGPLTPRQQRIADRAFRRAVDPSEIARHFGRTKASIFRALARQRAQRLHDLLPALQVGTHAQGHAPASAARKPQSPLESADARTGLGAPAPLTLAAMIAYATANALPDPRAERARAAAYWHLRRQAAALIAALPPHSPHTTDLDRIETLLRWGSRLKAELVRSQLSLILKTIHSRLDRELTSAPRAVGRSLVVLCIDTVIDATEQFDPARGGRLASPCAVALNKAVSHWALGPGAPWLSAATPARASPRLDPATIDLPDWTGRVDPWQAWLEPDPRVRPMAVAQPPAPTLPEPDRSLLLRRFGWDAAGASAPPATLADVAANLKMTLMHATRVEHRALRLALRLARAEGPRMLP
jgi:hypothetical protein